MKRRRSDRAEASIVQPGSRWICRLRGRRRGGGGGRPWDPRRIVGFQGRVPVPPLGGLPRSGGHRDLRRGRDCCATGQPAPGFPSRNRGDTLGAAAFGVPGNWYRMAKGVPMIHDITTDTENPPGFVSILPLRKDASNPAEYGGPEIAAKQHAAYPDIRPLARRHLPFAGLRSRTRRGRAHELADRRRKPVRTADRGCSHHPVVRLQGRHRDPHLPCRQRRERAGYPLVSRVGLSDLGTNARRSGRS